MLKHQIGQSCLQSEQRGRQADHVSPELNSLPPLTTSITGNSCMLTIEELISMPVQQFEELWQVAATAQALCAVASLQNQQ
jgi:hypothetical protein